MRLFLDAHVSGPRIATALRREGGHDVRSADEKRFLDGWSDDDLLTLASEELRIMVTFNVHDFPRIVQRWSEAGHHHGGCAIPVGIDHSEFGTILRVISSELSRRPHQDDWRDYTCFISRHT